MVQQFEVPVIFAVADTQGTPDILFEEFADVAAIHLEAYVNRHGCFNGCPRIAHGFSDCRFVSTRQGIKSRLTGIAGRQGACAVVKTQPVGFRRMILVKLFSDGLLAV